VRQVSTPELVQQLGAIGVVPGMVLVVHTSFRHVGPVEGGPTGLIDALTEALGPRGTLVMPTMSGSRSLTSFDPATTPTRNMGVVAETFRQLPGVVRSTHPTSSFAARGPLAAAITAPQPLTTGHGPDSPIGRVHAADGSVLLLGVGHDANTTIHLAEHLAEVPYRIRKWTTIEANGRPERVEYDEIDHCCQNFELVGEWLDERGLQRYGAVGYAESRLARARDIVDVTVRILRDEPLRFLHAPGAGCEDCDLARGGPARDRSRGPQRVANQPSLSTASPGASDYPRY